MEELKLPTITQELYDQVEELVIRAKNCSSLKDAQIYIDCIESKAYMFQGRCRYKLADVTGMLKEYCKRNADKAFYGMHLANVMGALESMIEETDMP